MTCGCGQPLVVMATDGRCPKCGALVHGTQHEPTREFVRAEWTDRVPLLAAAMRAVGAGRATLDGLTLDLTVAPMPATAAARETQRTMSDEEIRTRDERVLFGAGAGKRVALR